jgi:site-specific DNA recombinase
MSPKAAKRAVLYLPVSSRGQLDTDYGEDGLSIAGEREKCTRKAADLGATIVDEYVERAESAKTDGRQRGVRCSPEFARNATSTT